MSRTQKKQIKRSQTAIILFGVTSCLAVLLIPDAWSLTPGCPARLFEDSKNRGSDSKAGCLGRQPSPDASENLATHMFLEESANSGCRILVFVSFSMPEVSLKSLAQEVNLDQNNTCRPILVMRGLYQDSFARTAEKLKDLGIAVEINPELFEDHQITAVPTFLFVRDGKSPHRLRGNVTLAFASKTFEEQGEQAEEGATP